MQINIDFTKLSAPSPKFHRMCGFGPVRRGQRPSSRVIIAYDHEGRTWQHKRLFLDSEGQTAVDLMKKIEKVGVINTDHWRLADRKEY